MPDLLDRVKSALADRYAIERELGSGGMATVYLARDGPYDRRVAIKVLQPGLAAAVGPDRVPREIVLAARVEHLNTLPLHDTGEADGLPYDVRPHLELMVKDWATHD